MGQTGAVVPQEKIEKRIFTVRAQKVMLDSDLADLYGVTTKRLNEQVRRNRGRFPADFMFRLTKEEAAGLRSQNATSKGGRGGRRYPPSVFTEHGAIMLASVLNTTRAIGVSVYVVRAFVRLRHRGVLRWHSSDRRKPMPCVDLVFRVEEVGPGYGALRRRTRKQSVKA